MIKTPLSTVIGGAFWTPGATILGSSSQNLTQVIKSIFATGEQGFAYDPNDLATMYQDAASNFLVTNAGQPVGLVLDKSTGLRYGPELIPGGNFESGLIGTKTDESGSVSTWELNTVNPISGTSDGLLTITTAAGFRPVLRFNRTSQPVIGKVYEVTFDYKVVSGSVSIGLATLAARAFYRDLSGNGRIKLVYVATSGGTTESFYFTGSAGAVQIDNVSSREIIGNHAYQSTSAARPILRDAPRRIDFDAVDDKLITNLQAQLTDCTVIRSVPNVGTQILTGRTIPAIYEDNTDHCGLIVINRALTPSETSAITAEFNKRAGV